VIGNDPAAVIAIVPLRQVLGYRTDLRVLTQGHAQFTMALERYDDVIQAGPPDDTFPQAAEMRA
jgi:translation elongation factor EF-G